MLNLLKKKVDFLAIGDITTDAFIRLKEASVHCDIKTQACQICMKFADKIPFESVTIVKAVGNSANAAVSASRLGISSALIAWIGDDQNGRECLQELESKNVDTSYITKQKNIATNYHYVLWYEAERTILVKHQEFAYKLPAIKTPKWIYLSSLGSNSEVYHGEIAAYLKDHPEVKLAFQPGTFQMKLGTEKLADIYRRTEVFVCNVEEAQKILKVSTRDLRELMSGLAALGPRIVCVTDGPQGAYMYDTTTQSNPSTDAAEADMYYMPIYPDIAPPQERTGCGDAFASTFVAELIHGKTPLQALSYAPVNPMNVVQHVGAQQGLLTQDEVETYLAKRPSDYEPKKI